MKLFKLTNKDKKELGFILNRAGQFLIWVSVIMVIGLLIYVKLL